MENFIKSDIDFEDNELSKLVNSLRYSFEHSQNSFLFTCRDVYKIWSYSRGNYFKAKDNEYYNSYKLLAKFGFDKKAVSRYKNCYVRFILDDSIQTISLRVNFENFSPSKLFELLVLSDDTLYNLIENKVITPEMTCKQIREYIKLIKNGINEFKETIENTTINEEEIPMAYNPKQEYEYSYFETKTKNQLLNIVWELQKEYQKLRGEKKNAKQSNK